MRINVVHASPPSSSAFGQDSDGFTAAVELLATRHEVRWLNVHPYYPPHRAEEALIPDADFVLVRSDWLWLPTQATDRALRGLDTPVGLLIAGSTLPPPLDQQLRFDVLWYETPWYAQFMHDHPFAVEAFGIDTRAMVDLHLRERPIDWLFVGRLASFKRPERLLSKTGRRVVVGDLGVRRPDIEGRLIEAGVELLDHVSQAELAALYNRATTVLVPCELQGGGERAVLEGRACGCAIEIAEDNPKLASLLTSPLRSHEHYCCVLEESITAVVTGGRRVPPGVKMAGQRARARAIMVAKARRAPHTVWIRARDQVQAHLPTAQRGPL